MEWICGSICTGLFVVSLVWLVRARFAHLADLAKLEREGKVVKAWIVFAEDQLYKPNPASSVLLLAQVVFILDELGPGQELDRILAEIAEGIRTIQLGYQADWEERCLHRVVTTHIPYAKPLQVPRRLTGGLTAWTASQYVPCKFLPGGRLTKPYIFVKAFAGVDLHDRCAEVVAYPESEFEEEPKNETPGWG